MAWRGGLCASAALLWVLAMPGCGAAFANTPSFDCTGATAPIELLICGNDDLSQADRELADLYRRVRGSLDEGQADPAELTRLAQSTPSPAVPIETVPTAAPVQESLPIALGLERSILPASGEQSTLLSIAQFGRYSISVKSARASPCS